MSGNRRRGGGGGGGGSITRSCRRMRSSRGMFCHENDLRLGTVTPLESTHTIAQKNTLTQDTLITMNALKKY